MARRKDIEGSVRPTPGGSGQWQARLPYRLDAHRGPLPGTFASESAAWSALRAAIVDMDRNAGLRPRGRPTGKVRRVRDVLSDYIAARKSSALAPIAIRTVRDYRSVLENHVSRKSADIGGRPVHKLTGRDIRQWMDDLAADGVGVGTIANARRVLGAAGLVVVAVVLLGVAHYGVRDRSHRPTALAVTVGDEVRLQGFDLTVGDALRDAPPAPWGDAAVSAGDTLKVRLYWLALAAPAQDYKRIFAGDQGPNTGGMGSYCPVPGFEEAAVDAAMDRVVEPVLSALRTRGVTYRGVLYAGLIVSAAGVKVLEFNCRFGGTETQAVLPRLRSELLGLRPPAAPLSYSRLTLPPLHPR